MNMKKLFSLIMALLMAFSMVAVAEEVEDEQDLVVLPRATTVYTVTIKNAMPGHTYEAYQIFRGKLSTGGILTEIEWGNGVKGDELLTALKADATIGSFFTDCTTAADVADQLADATNFADDSVNLFKFAEIVEAHISDTKAESKYANGNYTMESLPAGYYLVKDKDNTVPDTSSATRYILKVVENVTVESKNVVPEVDKKIDGATDEDDGTTGDVEANQSAIGDKVPYKVTSKVPNMAGYEHYYFVVNDTLSKGLTFNNDVAIKIGNKTLVKDTDYTVTITPNEDTGETNVKIVFKNFIQYNTADYVGKDILITYSATINTDAVINGAGNPNKVTLVYSNDPNAKEEGTPGDEPGPNSPVGETPAKITRTFVTEVTLNKEDENGNKLTGATFEITGEKLETVLITEGVFKQDENGTYWKLKNGTYTLTDPNGADIDASKYESTTIKYALTTETRTQTKTTDVQYTATVDANGQLKFTGLAAGTYTIKEIVAPDGYKLAADITLTITFTPPTDATGNGTWTYTWSGANVITGENKTAGAVVYVKNEKGTNLPSTGGVGTTYIYIGGVVLLMAAAVMLISKRRATVE